MRQWCLATRLMHVVRLSSWYHFHGFNTFMYALPTTLQWMKIRNARNCASSVAIWRGTQPQNLARFQFTSEHKRLCFEEPHGYGFLKWFVTSLGFF